MLDARFMSFVIASTDFDGLVPSEQAVVDDTYISFSSSFFIISLASLFIRLIFRVFGIEFSGLFILISLLSLKLSLKILFNFLM